MVNHMLTRRWDLGSGTVDYEEAWALQRELHAAVVEGRSPGTLLLLEHASVYTAGRRTAAWDRPTDGTPVIDVDRGGRITWHGPGQLVAYPIVRLREPLDVVSFVRALEQAVIDLCTELGLPGARVEGRSGVWIVGTDGAQDRKLAAIGVRVAKGVAMHGIAVNACPDLDAFSRIVPCGLPDAGVTSFTELLGEEMSVVACADRLEPHLHAALSAVTADDVEPDPASAAGAVHAALA